MNVVDIGEQVGITSAVAHLGVIAVEQGKEGGLCASRSLDAAEANVVSRSLEVAQIPQELLCARRSSSTP
jgi:hypothetical protein